MVRASDITSTADLILCLGMQRHDGRRILVTERRANVQDIIVTDAVAVAAMQRDVSERGVDRLPAFGTEPGHGPAVGLGVEVPMTMPALPPERRRRKVVRSEVRHAQAVAGRL